MDLAFVAKRLDAYERLIRLDKPIGTLLLLWPTLWAVWLASGGWPRPEILIIFVMGTLLMRSAGCAINDFADRNFDGHVDRTRARPLASGEVRPREALAVAALLAAAAFVLVLFLNWLAIVLSFVALAITMTYPFAKRFFALPQAYLGVAFGFGIPMAYAAIQVRLPAECWALFAANLFYAFAYDTEYAMVDREDDARLGLRTAALTLGRLDVVGVMASYGAMLAILLVLGLRLQFAWPYFLGLAAAAGLVAGHWRLIHGRSREGCFKAFMQSNWIGAAVFAGIIFWRRMSDPGPAITRFAFERGELRGTQLTLFPTCLVHRSDNHLETLPLGGVTAVRVSFERDMRKLGWAIGLVLAALVMLAIAGPMSSFAGAAAGDMASAGTQGVPRALYGFFRSLEALGSLLPVAALACVIGGGALGAFGWLGGTTLLVSLPGAERVYAVRGRDSLLLDFAEAVSERLMHLKQ